MSPSSNTGNVESENIDANIDSNTAMISSTNSSVSTTQHLLQIMIVVELKFYYLRAYFSTRKENNGLMLSCYIMADICIMHTQTKIIQHLFK